jgi:hypothetical protein
MRACAALRVGGGNGKKISRHDNAIQRKYEQLPSVRSITNYMVRVTVKDEYE